MKLGGEEKQKDVQGQALPFDFRSENFLFYKLFTLALAVGPFLQHSLLCSVIGNLDRKSGKAFSDWQFKLQLNPLRRPCIAN